MWSVRARRRGWDLREAEGASPLVDRWTTVGGTRVFFRESRTVPTAPAMVHLHGFAMSGRYLLPTAERLATTFHTLVPDLPGCGRSERPRTPLDIEDLAHVTAAFLDERGIGSATLVGHSVGCAVITEFAHLYPQRLDRAVLDSLCRRFGGGPVGISTLAVAVGEERETVEEVAEPFLVRNGFLARTPRGRVATRAAWEHLGLTAPPAQPAQPGEATLFES